MTATDQSTHLAPHRIESFQHNGFLALDAISTPEEIAWLREIYDRLFDEQVGWESGAQFDLAGDESGDGPPKLPELVKPSKYVPELKDTVYRTRARQIASELLGEEVAEEPGEFMIRKPARIGPATPWHQDQAYLDPATWYRSVTFWMPLDDVTVERGCMQFVPGSHREGHVHPHQPIGNNPAVSGLEVADPDAIAEYAVACPVPAGGCTMHSAYTLHYTGPNLSDDDRRAYTLTFRLDNQPREIPVDNYWLAQRKTKGQERRDAAAAKATESK